jgi:hypothetical protein
MMGENGDAAVAKEILLIGCGWIPIVGAACDAYGVKRSINDKDAVGASLGMAGFVPLFGDLAKFPKQLKHLDDVLEAADKAKDASTAAKVTP